MSEQQRPVPSNPTTVKMLILLIILLLVCIALRWNTIKREVVESVQWMFPTEAPADTTAK